MKKVYLFISMIILVILACSSATVAIPTNPAPTNIAAPTQIPATSAPSETTTTLPPPSGTSASFGPLSLVLPSGLSSGISGSQLSRADGQDVPYWGLTPGHTQIDLNGYVLQGKFHKPQIFIYPAQAYAELVPAAFENIHRLNNILGNPGASINSDQLPTVPFFNAAQVFASNIQIVTFQSGRGVRFLTEYAQYAASANNHDLFYEFQGLTSDGAYYIIAILPITSPLLGETSDPASAVSIGGVAFPNMGDPNADWKGYYNAVTVQLNAQAPTDFVPTLNLLDLLIQSIRITP
ncbi:MAG TPA: hypothetical protein VIN60_08160 [Anaerolineales bacterium]